MRLHFIPLVVLLFACRTEEDTKVDNSNPVVEITSHVDGDSVFSSEVVRLQATVSDAESNAAELSVQWTFGDRVACPYTPPERAADRSRPIGRYMRV